MAVISSLWHLVPYVVGLSLLAVVTQLVLLLVHFLQDVRRCLKISRALKDIPCPVEKSHWLLGSMAEHAPHKESGLMRQCEWLKSHPYYYSMDYGGISRHIVLHHPSTIKLALKRASPKIFNSFGWTYGLSSSWLGESLVLASGQKWQRNRRLVSPAFHFEILKGYMETFNKCTDELLDKIRAGSNNGEQSVDVLPLFGKHTLKVILQCAFSVESDVDHVGPTDSSTPTYIDHINTIQTILFQRNFSPLLRLDIVFYNTKKGKMFKSAVEHARSLPRDVMQARRATVKELDKERKYRDFLDILLLARDEDGNPMTDQEIMDESQLFLFAGLDSTKSALSFFLYNMAKYPEIQAKVRAEIGQLVEGRANDDILFEDLSKMPYTTQCIKESLRMYPPFPHIGRELDVPMQLDGHVLPVGTPVDINIWNEHHNPLVWGDDHMTFNPDRFSQANVVNLDPFAFVPFSAGPRNCVGQNFAMNEIKVVLAKLLQNFEVDLDQTCDYEIEVGISLNMPGGMRMFLKPK